MAKRYLAAILSLMVWVAFAGLLFAQRADRAIITGLVSDPVGAAVPQATVTIVNEATGDKTVISTSEAGNYASPQLILGPYTVRVEKEGFKAFVRSGILLTPGANYRQDATMQLGAVTQTVEVTAFSEMINSTTAETAHAVNERYYTDLPVVMGADIRLAEALLHMEPGYVPMQPNGDSMFRGSQFNSRINGGQTMVAENWFDGAAFGYAEGHQQTQESSPPIEAIKEVKVTTGVLSAQYGRTSGGFIEYVTKSGTSEYHGSVYGFYINKDLRARHFFEREKDPLMQKSYGFTLGGPIKKGKTFFFTNLDFMNLRQVPNAGFVNNVPLPELRQGDFSALLTTSQIGTDALGRPIYQGQIFDPSTTRLVNGVPVRDPFPANIIPAGHPLLSSVAGILVPLIPLPDRPTVFNNSFGAPGDPIKSIDVMTWMMRVDHSFTPNFKMTSTFVMNERPGNARKCGGPDHCFTEFDGKSSPEKNVNYIGQGFYQRIANRFAHQQFEWIIKPNLFNHTTIAWDRWTMEGHSLSGRVGWRDRLGTGLLDNTAGPGTFNFSGNVPYSYLGNNWQEGANINNRWQFLDDLTWIKGKHTVKVGFEYRRHQFINNGWGRNTGGNFNFNRLETGGYDASGNNLGQTGDPFASFMLGQVHDAGFTIPTQPAVYEKYASPWFHDEIKLTSRLTLNVGLRWDYQSGKEEGHDRWSNFDPTVPNPGAGGIPGAMVFAGTGSGRIGKRSFEEPAKDAFGPRLGFAYRLSDKNVVRGGYGIYYSGVPASQFMSYPQIGFESNPTAPNLTNGLFPAYFWDDGFPQANIIFPPFIDPTTANGTSPIAIAKDSVDLPRYQNWSLSFQRQVSANLLLDVSYVGNKGTRLINHWSTVGPAANMNDPSVLALGASGLQADCSTPACPQQPYASFVGNVAQALRPFPQYQAILWRNINNGSSIYHSLQTTLDKRFSNGLQARIAYTWSRLTNDGAESGQGGFGAAGNSWQGSGIQNPVDYQRGERGLSLDDIPHTLIVAYTYELPFGKGKKFGSGVSGPANKVIGGWKISALQRYQSGRPLSITMANDLGGLLFNISKRPNKVGGGLGVTGGDFDPAKDRYLVYSGWSDPGPLKFGNALRTDPDIRSFPLYSEDFNIFKDTLIYGEKVTLRFDVQLGNIFNRHFFCNPDTNFSSGNFGGVGGQCNLPRRIQLGARFDF